MRRLVVVLVVAACGDNAAPRFARDLQHAECDYAVRCHVATALDDCLAFYRAKTTPDDNVRTAIEHDKIVFDPDAAGRCLDAYQTVSCDQTQEPIDAFATCSDVFAGQLANGATCAFSLECASGRCDRPDCAEGTCCTGQCAPAKPIPGDGEPCTSACDDADFCGADDVCHPYGAAAAPCDDTRPCGYALYCAGRSPNTPGACTPLPHLGEACETGCADAGATCRDGTCKPVRLAGEACSADSDCSSFYVCDAQTCSAYAAPAKAAASPSCY